MAEDKEISSIWDLKLMTNKEFSGFEPTGLSCYDFGETLKKEIEEIKAGGEIRQCYIKPTNFNNAKD